jgi:hypothetical protein
VTQGAKQLFDLTTLTTEGAALDAGIVPPFGPGLTGKDEFTQGDESRGDVDLAARDIARSEAAVLEVRHTEASALCYTFSLPPL